MPCQVPSLMGNLVEDLYLQRISYFVIGRLDTGRTSDVPIKVDIQCIRTAFTKSKKALFFVNSWKL